MRIGTFFFKLSYFQKNEEDRLSCKEFSATGFSEIDGSSSMSIITLENGISEHTIFQYWID